MSVNKPNQRRKKSASPSTSDNSVGQNRVSNVRLAPLTPEQAIRGMFKIKPADVKRIIASKPGRKKKG